MLNSSVPRVPRQKVGYARSVPQFGPIAEVFERLGIGQRLDISHRLAMPRVAHRQFAILPRLVCGISTTLRIFAGAIAETYALAPPLTNKSERSIGRRRGVGYPLATREAIVSRRLPTENLFEQ